MNPLITSNPAIRFGRPCITGTRISVDDIKQYVASGMSQDEILAGFPDLKPEHIQAAIAYQGPTLHAMFSEQAANQFGSSIYSTPDGREVEVTRVYPSEWPEPMYDWADKVHVGEVKERLRRGRPAPMGWLA